MKIKFSTYRIKLNHSFGISRSSHDYYDIVYFYLVDENIVDLLEYCKKDIMSQLIISFLY